MVCKQMVEDWPIGQGAFKGEYISQVAPTWVQNDGTVTMAISRGVGNIGHSEHVGGRIAMRSRARSGVKLRVA
jgi:hypothetical protein